MAIQINGTSGISGVDGSAATPALQGTDTNTGLTFGTDTVGVVTGGTTRTTVDSSGRLLVGTSTSPAPGGNISTFIGENNASTSTTSNLAIYTNTAQAANVGGTISLGGQWTTSSDYFPFASISGRKTNSTSGNADGYLQFNVSDDATYTMVERTRIKADGETGNFYDNYGVSFRTAASSGNSIEIIYCTRNATNVTNGTGVFAVYTNGSYATLSDQTRKKNIETTRDGYLDDLNRLRVVKYNWNEQQDDEPKELGLIAQEVEQVFPGLISQMRSVDEETEEETSTKSIKYSVLPVMLLKALQEADQKIEAQSALIESQAATIAALDARLTALEGGTN